MTEPIFHLAQPSDWARSIAVYSPASVDEEGFVHCSTGQQLAEVARTFYSGHNDLILLTIDPGMLEEGTLVYEDLYQAGQDFPHVYGPLPCKAVASTGPYLNHLEEGLWGETRLDPEWMERILHPDFTVVGVAGDTHTREEILTGPRVELEAELPHEDYRFDLIDEDVGLARYTSHHTYDGVERTAHRSSVWVNTNEGWRLRFHQGTPLDRTG